MGVNFLLVEYGRLVVIWLHNKQRRGHSHGVSMVDVTGGCDLDRSLIPLDRGRVNYLEGKFPAVIGSLDGT